MGAMVRDLMMKSPLLVLPLLAMALFLAVFAGVVIRTWLRKPDELAKLADLALKGDD
jgi:hypothetical protein